MFALIRHALRQLAPVLRVLGVVLAGSLVIELVAVGRPLLTGMAWPVLAALVLFSPSLLYSSKFGGDFWLPVRRASLYHAKMAVICVTVIVGIWVPFVLLEKILPAWVLPGRGGAHVTFLLYLLAGVSVSAALWHALVRPKASVAVGIGILLVCACLVPAYTVLAIYISLGIGFGQPWLAPCLLTASVIAYWSGFRTFCRHELAPAHGLGAGAGRATRGHRRSLERGRDATELPAAHGSDRTGAGGSKTASSLVDSADRYGKPARHAVNYAEPWRGSSSFHPIPSSWAFPPFLMHRVHLFFIVCGLLIFLWLLWDFSAQLSRLRNIPPFEGLWLISWFGWSFASEWGRMISLLPVAYPRRRLVSVVTAWILVPLLIWSMVSCLWFRPWTVAVVATGMLADISCVIWLSVPPHPLHTKARRAYHVLLVGYVLGLLLLFFGLGILDPIFQDYSVALLLQHLWANVVAGLAQPSVAWPVAGLLALVAILLWSHAYVRFKYMEGVPPGGGSYPGR
ncbi:MAG: hypothetical protein AB1646_12900 [Thermodesulfobacteriota bacterium]